MDLQIPKKTFFFIPHTHWEGAVFKTREEYLEIGLPNILRALKLLKTYPTYRFVLDQACYVSPFLERYPEEADTLRKFVKEGRIAIVGGTDVMLDVNMPCGESFVRQVLYGKGLFRKEFGVDVTVGWQLDTFGHHAQMPQLLKLAGFHSFWFFRGVPDLNTPSEFQWQGIDGSQISAFWLPHGYAISYGSPRSLMDFSSFIEQRFDSLEPFSRGGERVGLAGADVSQPEAHIPDLVEQFNRQPDAPFHIRIALPADYEESAACSMQKPIVAGELNPIFQGAYSSRIELKQRNREIERLLSTAEKLGALLSVQGERIDDQNVWRAWEPTLFNQAHDLMSGVMTDHVYEDTLRGYDLSQRLAEEELNSRWRRYCSLVETNGEGIAIVVFNSLSWTRTDIAITQVGFSDSGVMSVEMIDPEGEYIPVQLIDEERDEDGCLLRADVAFLAKDIPALGHCVYRLIPQKRPAANIPVARRSEREAILENEHYHISIDSVSGAITSLKVKKGNWEALSGRANVVCREKDEGDLWELYRPLDAGSRIAQKSLHGVPHADLGEFSDAHGDEAGIEFLGPVYSEFKVAHHFGDGSFQTLIRVYTGLRRIDIRTRLLNNQKFVRYRALFPTSILNGRSVHEIPFGAIERPESIEMPVQNWVDWSSDERGLALLNRGLPGNNVADGTIMLSLLRSTCIVAYGYGGGYEPGMSSETGFEIGKEFIFDYALVPHSGDWRDAGVYRDGLEFNNPLLASTAEARHGMLPACQGFLDISHANVVVSTLKMCEEGLALRVYEAAGLPANGVRINLSSDVIRAYESNLMEDILRELDVNGNAIVFDLSAFEIKTFILRLQKANQEPRITISTRPH